MKEVTDKIQNIFHHENDDGGICVRWYDKETGKLTGEENYKNGVTFPKDENGDVDPTGVLHGFTTYFDTDGDVVIRYFYQNNELVFGWDRNDDGKMEFRSSIPLRPFSYN